MERVEVAVTDSRRDGRSWAETFRAFHRKDIELTDRFLGRTPLHHAYWPRKRIDAAVAGCAHLAYGDLLDVGCGLKPYEKVFEPHVDRFIGLEYKPESGYRGNKAEISGDASDLPIADESFDTVLCTEMIVNLPDTDQAIGEFARVLRPGGIMIVTAPFVYPLHDAADFYRFTRYGIANIMERKGLYVERVVALSGTAITIGQIFNLYWYDTLFMWTKWLYPIGLLIRPILWLLSLMVNLVCRLFELLLPDGRLPFGHLTVARKI